MTRQALIGLAIFLALVIVYLVVRFEWRMAVAAVCSLAFDLVLTAIGYNPAGKRIYRRGSGKTKAKAKAKTQSGHRNHDEGLTIAQHGYTVADALNDWLAYGLAGRSDSTRDKLHDPCPSAHHPGAGRPQAS